MESDLLNYQQQGAEPQDLVSGLSYSIVANYQQKLLDLIEIKFKQWNYHLNNDLIDEVKEWESQ